MLLSNQKITKEIKQEIKIYPETNDNENTMTKPMGCSKSSLKRKFYRIQSYLKNKKNLR